MHKSTENHLTDTHVPPRFDTCCGWFLSALEKNVKNLDIIKSPHYHFPPSSKAIAILKLDFTLYRYCLCICKQHIILICF